MSYSEAASILTGTVSEMRQMLGSRLGMLVLYQIRDQEPPGATTNDEIYLRRPAARTAAQGRIHHGREGLLASS